MAKTDITTSLETNSQIPLDAKVVVKTLDELRRAVENEVVAKYHEDLVVSCLEDHNKYVWREEKYLDEPSGLLIGGAYTYPSGSSTTEPQVDYSNRKFNFFLGEAFDSDFAARLRDLVYKDATASLSLNQSPIEKGLETEIIFSWVITPNDDTFDGFTFDGVAVPSTSQAFNLTETTTKTLSVDLKRTKDLSQVAEDVNLSVSKTVYFYSPQYVGKLSSVTLEPSSYTVANLNSISDSKYVMSSDTITASGTYSNEFAFFITNSNSTVFKDGNDFTLSVGDFNSTTAFIIKKSVTVTLANGSTETMYFYRTRETVNTTTTFKLS